MKTISNILTVILVIGLSYSSYAQKGQRERPPVEERVNRAIEVIERRIELSESEKRIINEAFTVFYKQVDEEVQKDGKPNREVIEVFEKDRDEKVKKVLKQEEYEDYLRLTCLLRPRPDKRMNKEGNRPDRKPEH